MLELPKSISVKGRDGRIHDDVRMWHYMALQEGTLGVDPEFQKTNDGRMPPVIHVDTDAPLYSDRDGTLITDRLWGLYYKPDFNFGGIQGGSSPYKVEGDPDDVAVDPYGPDSPDFIVGDMFIETGLDRLTPELVGACQERDIRVMVLQSNNDPDAFRRILEWQVDMVNLNHADTFLAVQRAQADALTGLPFAPR